MEGPKEVASAPWRVNAGEGRADAGRMRVSILAEIVAAGAPTRCACQMQCLLEGKAGADGEGARH